MMLMYLQELFFLISLGLISNLMLPKWAETIDSRSLSVIEQVVVQSIFFLVVTNARWQRNRRGGRVCVSVFVVWPTEFVQTNIMCVLHLNELMSAVRLFITVSLIARAEEDAHVYAN